MQNIVTLGLQERMQGMKTLPGSRRLTSATVLTSLIALVVVAASNASATQERAIASVSAVSTDIDISGPFLQHLTKNPHSAKAAQRCGEPEIAQDALHPSILVMDCMSSELNYETPMSNPLWALSKVTNASEWRQWCYTFISRDGGNTWRPVNPQPLMSGGIINSCADPLAEAGPSGELYLAEDAGIMVADNAKGPMTAHGPLTINVGGSPWASDGLRFTRSLDGGKTWSALSRIPTAIDRPFWTVDESTGDLYEVSGCIGYASVVYALTRMGAYGCTSESRNLAVSSDQGRRWDPLVGVTNQTLPTTALAPGRLHNINADGGASVIAAARGVFATAGNGGFDTKPTDVGVFKFSVNNGATFTERPIPLGNAGPCPSPVISGLAADPAGSRTFALIVLCAPNSEVVRVFVTHDLGTNWTETADLAAPPPSGYVTTADDARSSSALSDLSTVVSRVATPYSVNRPWVAYGPTGALGVIWRQNYGAVPGGEFGHAGGPQDVFVAISNDGGAKFTAPIRVNTAASPAADPRQIYGDDTSEIMVGRHYAYAVWGDWRSGELETWFRKVPIPGH